MLTPNNDSTLPLTLAVRLHANDNTGLNLVGSFMSNKQTALYELHLRLGARMVPFAGYDMPVQYTDGIIKEHLHTRAKAGLFDVSHMGQLIVEGPHAASELETLMPADIQGLALLHSTYSLLTNTQGGVEDDLIVTRLSDERFMLVVNAGCKMADLAIIQAGCAQSVVTMHDERALLALQGPRARDVLVRLAPDVGALTFMSGHETVLADTPCFVTCSGYTGEDGFEISVPNTQAQAVAELLLAEPEFEAIGLGARDSLRLEAGLCLYGHELSADISPVEAGLRWAIASVRRPGGEREGGYPGAAIIAGQMAGGVSRVRVGLRVEGKRPVREGQVVLDAQGEPVGIVTSGGFGPSVAAPVAMAFVTPECRAVDSALNVDVRGTSIGVRVVPLPMVPPGYHRG